MSIAAAVAATSAAQTQIALSTAILKQQHEAQAAIINTIEQAAQNLAEVAASPPPGYGGNVDISV